MDGWLNWSPSHPPQIYSRLFGKPSKWNWRVPLPTWVAPNNSHKDPDGGAGDEVRADGLQPSKQILNPRPMPRRLLARISVRPMQMADAAVGACRQTSAKSVVALVTGLFSVHHEEEHMGDEEVDEDAVEEEVVMLAVEVKAKVKFSLLLWLSRGQMRLGLCCNQIPTLPQCPVAVTRETSCALSWPARTAAGAVGRSGAS